MAEHQKLYRISSFEDMNAFDYCHPFKGDFAPEFAMLPPEQESEIIKWRSLYCLINH